MAAAEKAPSARRIMGKVTQQPLGVQGQQLPAAACQCHVWCLRPDMLPCTRPARLSRYVCCVCWHCLLLLVQDIGESEASELVRLYQPLLQRLLPAVLEDVDLSHQEIHLEEVVLKQLVGVRMCVWGRGSGLGWAEKSDRGSPGW